MTDLELQLLRSVERGDFYRTGDSYHRRTGPAQYVEVTHAETRTALLSLEADGMLTFADECLNLEWRKVRPSDTGAVVLLANGGAQ